MNSNNRDLGIDFAKALACFAVIVLHVARSSSSAVCQSLYFLSGFAIPVFFMANGWFMLNRTECGWPYLARKVARVLLVVLGWSVLVSAILSFRSQAFVNPLLVAAKSLFQRGELSHLWFFLSLIALWLLTPALRALTARFGRVPLLLSLLSCFAFSIWTFYAVATDSLPPASVVPQPLRMWTWAACYLLGGSLARFVCGRGGGARTRRLALAAVLLAACSWALQYAFGYLGHGVELAEYWYDSPVVLAYAACLLLLCRSLLADLRPAGRVARAVEACSGASMGVYIVHYPVLRAVRPHVDLTGALPNLVFLVVFFALCLELSLALGRLRATRALVRL